MAGFGNLNNNSSDVSRIVQFSAGTFLALQGVRQLLIANRLGKESAPGKTSVYFTAALYWCIAAVIAFGGKLITDKQIGIGSLFAISLAALFSGVFMMYDAVKHKDNLSNVEKDRLWFSIAHVLFGLIIFFVMLYLLRK
jgi:uncharacterized membrane protein